MIKSNQPNDERGKRRTIRRGKQNESLHQSERNLEKVISTLTAMMRWSWKNWQRVSRKGPRKIGPSNQKSIILVIEATRIGKNLVQLKVDANCLPL